MTRITEEQHDQLTRITNLYSRRRAVRSEVLKELDLLIQTRTDRINEDLYQAVREAIENKIPRSRIGAAIGTRASVTWNKLIEDALGAPEKAGGAEETPSTVPPIKIHKGFDWATVGLDHYFLGGEVVTGLVEFVADDGEWLVQGDSALDFAVERALFGNEQDANLRAQWDAAVA